MMKTRKINQSIGEDDILNIALHRGILITDGEREFVEATIQFMKTKEWKNSMFNYGKFSPCTSGVPSGNPLDQCPAFKNTKQLLKSWKSSTHIQRSIQTAVNADNEIDEERFSVHDPDYGFLESPVNTALSEQLQKYKLRLTHITAIKKFLFRMQSIIPKSFATNKLILGWTIGGYAPWYPYQSLAMCNGFNSLPRTEQDRIIKDVLPAMIQEFSRTGHCTDAFMDNLKVPAGAFGNGERNCTVVTDPFDKKSAINQRRATMLSHPHQIELRKGELADQKKVLEERKKKGKRRLMEYKSKLERNKEEKCTGTLEHLRSILEALEVPLIEYCKNPDKPNSKLSLVKQAMIDLVQSKVLQHMNSMDEDEDDGYSSDEDHL